MTRREFIAFLGGAAAVWPIVARAQQQGIPHRHPDRAAEVRGSGYEPPSWMRCTGTALMKAAIFELTTGEYINPDASHGCCCRTRSHNTGRSRLILVLRRHLALKKTGTTVPIVFGQVADPVAIGLGQASRGPAATSRVLECHGWHCCEEASRSRSIPRAAKSRAFTRPGKRHEKIWRESNGRAAELGKTAGRGRARPGRPAGHLKSACSEHRRAYPRRCSLMGTPPYNGVGRGAPGADHI